MTIKINKKIGIVGPQFLNSKESEIFGGLLKIEKAQHLVGVKRIDTIIKYLTPK